MHSVHCTNDWLSVRRLQGFAHAAGRNKIHRSPNLLVIKIAVGMIHILQETVFLPDLIMFYGPFVLSLKGLLFPPLTFSDKIFLLCFQS